MSAPVAEHRPDGRLVVRRAPRPAPGPSEYALATRTGVELLGLILAASQHWRPLTACQRHALRCAVRDALAAIPADIADGSVVPLPLLPAGTRPATARSLERRGLAADGRLTPLAVEIVEYAAIPDARDVTTVQPVGGVL